MTGYSGTPLPRKLGIKPDHSVLVLGAPEGFALDGAITAAYAALWGR